MLRSSLLAGRKPLHPVKPAAAFPAQSSERENDADNSDSTNDVISTTTPIKSLARKVRTSPLLPSAIKPKSETAQSQSPSAVLRYFRCLFCARTNKKHKTWQDGVLLVDNRMCSLIDDSAKCVTKRLANGCTAQWSEGNQMFLGNWEIELTDEMQEHQYMSGECFIKQSMVPTPASVTGSSQSGAVSQPLSVSASSKFVNTPFTPIRKPASTITTKSAQSLSKSTDPDLSDPSLLILNRAQLQSQPQSKKTKSESPVIVESFLSRVLRPHQIDGVQFLYDCVMGLRTPQCYGAILADDMGLGKTLQTITLLYTLLKQGPINNEPVIRKAVIVCPSTLVKNWEKEFSKWLTSTRLKPSMVDSSLTSDDQSSVVNSFIIGNANSVLIIGYELYRKHGDRLSCINSTSSQLNSLLLICDEGHRLKNSKGNATIGALATFQSLRRVLLTGTPIQNDLMEFFAMAEFVNPKSLGSIQTFRATFEQPINRSRDSAATKEQRKLGEARSQQLAKMTQSFVLRRSADILRKYLPIKNEFLLFCRLSPFQCEIYEKILKSKVIAKTLRSQWNDSGGIGQQPINEILALSCINSLKQVCNHPRLIYGHSVEATASNDSNSELMGVSDCYADDYDAQPLSVTESGKFHCLFELIAIIHANSEKCVIVSNYVKTLDLIEQQCESLQYGYFRLDGQTPADRRQSQVDQFNNSALTKNFLFLLSSKAGGMGLNLIGAQSLILVDPDWNPAIDLQAMARIWRDGQSQPVNIYRLIATGSIDEKILQRQIKKLEIARAVQASDGKARGRKSMGGAVHRFNQANLRALFVLKPHTGCDTYDLLTKKSSDDSDTDAQALAIIVDTRDSGSEGVKELTIGGRRWGVEWDAAASTNPTIAALPSELVSCVFSITTHPMDARELLLAESAGDDSEESADADVTISDDASGSSASLETSSCNSSTVTDDNGSSMVQHEFAVKRSTKRRRILADDDE